MATMWIAFFKIGPIAHVVCVAAGTEEIAKSEASWLLDKRYGPSHPLEDIKVVKVDDLVCDTVVF